MDTKNENAIMLPYLTKDNKTSKHNNESQNKDFNLRLNNAVLPYYDPIKDKNLVYFFDKSTVKKRLASL